MFSRYPVRVGCWNCRNAARVDLVLKPRNLGVWCACYRLLKRCQHLAQVTKRHPVSVLTEARPAKILEPFINDNQLIIYSPVLFSDIRPFLKMRTPTDYILNEKDM